MRVAPPSVVAMVLLMISVGLAEDEIGGRPALKVRAEELIIARCSICHSDDLVRQQRVDRPHWEATVSKMRRWGAELTDDEAALLIDYLANRYHEGTPDRLIEDVPGGEPLRAGGVGLEGRPVGVARRGDVVFAQNCQACHGANGTGGVGPRLSRNPFLMDEERFWETVEQGRGAMPAWKAALAPQEIADVWEWLKRLE